MDLIRELLGKLAVTLTKITAGYRRNGGEGEGGGGGGEGGVYTLSGEEASLTIHFNSDAGWTCIPWVQPLQVGRVLGEHGISSQQSQPYLELTNTEPHHRL